MSDHYKDTDEIEEGIHCGFRGEHYGHHYLTDIGIEEWCNGFEPGFKSNPEADEEFDWDSWDDEPQYDSD